MNRPMSGAKIGCREVMNCGFSGAKIGASSCGFCVKFMINNYSIVLHFVIFFKGKCCPFFFRRV